MCENSKHGLSNSDVAIADGEGWSYEAALLKHGAYLLRESNRMEVAVIIATDDSRPMHGHTGANARLLVREQGSSDWYDAGRYVLAEATTQDPGARKRA